MNISHRLSEKRRADFVSSKPYLDKEKITAPYGEEEYLIDYCLGTTFKEGGNICRQILSLMKEG